MTAAPRTMIHLDRLTKRYPGQAAPAVDALELEVPEGEIVVLVGPSGCGKTTTLEMINRLVEPTSGRIVLDGEDVTDMQVDRLRRRIGYVIQEVGLFPHQTIAQNIATVPRLLGWDKDRIAERVDQLLELVGLDPAEYRHRRPKAMSGGQRQRIGVARAMAADPPVMLMDEPFGATDPITRERLQNEFLRIQSEIHKTIVFVTHDIDEAIKMGDRIAILRQGSRIAQYAIPEHILSDPADDFVEQFLGSGIVLKRLDLAHLSDLRVDTDWPTGREHEDHVELRRRLEASDHDALLLLDHEHRPRRWLRARELDGQGSPMDRGIGVEAILQPDVTLSDALQEMLTARLGVAVVVDRWGAYVGTVDLDHIQAAIRAMRDEARGRDRAPAAAGRPPDAATGVGA